MNGIPDSLLESAKLDGANEIVIAFRIYFPLSIPVLAAVTCSMRWNYWNDWWNAIMLIDNNKLYPLQYFLFKLQSEIEMLRDLQMQSASAECNSAQRICENGDCHCHNRPHHLFISVLTKVFCKRRD